MYLRVALACAFRLCALKRPYLRGNRPKIAFLVSGAQLHTARQKCEIRANLGGFARFGLFAAETCHLCTRFFAMATAYFDNVDL